MIDGKGLENRYYYIKQAITHIPKGFLKDFQYRTSIAYKEAFKETELSSSILQEQKLQRLIAVRYFHVESAFKKASENYGLSFTAKQLPENSFRTGYVSCGHFGFTQSYVQCIGDLPQPAKYREKLASAGNAPRLPLDEPSDIYKPKQHYAIFTHNPKGKYFSEEMQSLAELRLSIPYNDMKGWVLNISIMELIAHYPADDKKVSAHRAPTWKRKQKRRKEEER